MKKNFLFVFIYLLSFLSKAQDSIAIVISHEKKIPYKQLILPTGLIAAGAILKIPSLEDNLQNKSKNIFGNNFKTKVDDHMLYFPAILIFAGPILGFESQHNYKQMATNVVVSSLVTGSIIYVSKKSFGSLRPDQSSKTSYPSGHSALAFNLATLQFLEYQNSNIWYAYSGYLFATATAVLRVGNNRHWAGDVLTGAGIGIGVAVLVNYWSPFSKLNSQKIINKQLSIMGYPMISQNTYGVGVLLNINKK